MKQKKKKDEPPRPSSGTDEQQQQCNGAGEPRPKKSALKRTATSGGSKAAKSSKHKRHVQFNESLNVFFESDYVIVIRDDDCEFDEEDFDFWSQQPCSCGDESCFQPWLDDDDGRGMPPLDPYEEQPATLSPPDGYKDGCPRHVPPPSLDHLKYADDDLATRYGSDVMDSSSDTHIATPYNSNVNASSYFEDNQKNRHELSSLPRSCKDEQKQQQQQPPTNTSALQLSKTNTVCDTNSSTGQQPRCIVETITMTTVTERQIVQETRPMDVVDGACKTEDAKVVTGATAVTPDEGYVMIKCGNNTVLYNNRNPNSAVRQLFPSTKFVCPPTRIKETDDARLLNKYLITEESLRAFDSRSMNGGLSGGGFKSEPHSDDDDDDTSNSLIRRTIERSTLRRNTAKKKNVGDSKEISLIEKIRRLTCDSDDDVDDSAKKVSGPVQEQGTAYTVLVQCDSVTPSAATVATPAYKKLTELLSSGSGGGGRYDQPLLPSAIQSTADSDPTGKADGVDLCDGHSAVSSRAAVRSATSGKPFLSTLATACVTGNVHPVPGGSVAGGASQPSHCPQPDVVAGTQAPSSHRQEELVAFVQQDSGRLEKIRKRYMPLTTTAAATEDEDDENDDYGFNRRPEVHGIRSGFSAQITIKNNPQPPQRPRSYYGDPALQTPPLDVQPDFVPRYPATAVAAVRSRIQGDTRAPPPYPAASQRSIIRVTHGQQQQTIRVPYQTVGPVQVHLLTTAAAAASTATANVIGHPPQPQVQIRHPPNEYIVQHGHARIHHGQQFVIARGTQTAAISTTRYYQLPPPPPPNIQQQQQQLPQSQLPPHAFQPSDEHPATQFKQTSPTRGVAASGRLHMQQQQQQQEYVDHNLPSSVVSQTSKNPMLFYGMNV
ncbi:uncharacterized protein LOC132931584 [Rhopalosiphum padi]|uniref:uncharacterized protein LOC132931584 n=1 Tax=Rhopalosiphum padi TaxID=40932 RepID=UPI00298DC7F0|nr:uncharacterized protein LOC132931584 [Rhopalosiphum padi]